jgi:UMF1 family MFS transporter
MKSMDKSTWQTVISWTLYDWGNSAFATSIMAAFFPVFFKQYWSAGADVTASTLRLGLANSAVGALIFICAPVLGALADRGRTKKQLLGLFAFSGALCTGALFFVQQGQWPLATLLYAMASLGFFGGNIFYDSLLVTVAPPERLDFVSGLGFSIGYLGGGILLGLNILCVEQYQWFGFTTKTQAVRFAFLAVAIWWGLFTLPLLWNVPEITKSKSPPFLQLLREAFCQLSDTIRSIRQYRSIVIFLIAYFFYIDGVHTILKMSVDYAMSLGMDGSDLVKALLLTQFVAFPAALAFAFLGERWGALRGILLGISIYIVILFWASTMKTSTDFYMMAVAVGCVQGGVQALSRSFFGKMVPPNRSAEFFGFYNMVGKSSTILGPLMVGVAASLTGEPRISLLIIVVLFVIGAGFLFQLTRPSHIKSNIF